MPGNRVYHSAEMPRAELLRPWGALLLRRLYTGRTAPVTPYSRLGCCTSWRTACSRKLASAFMSLLGAQVAKIIGFRTAFLAKTAALRSKRSKLARRLQASATKSSCSSSSLNLSQRLGNLGQHAEVLLHLSNSK